MEVKETTNTKLEVKKARFEDGIIVDENGAEIDLNREIARFFGESTFNISVTTKTDRDLTEE